MLPLLSSGLPAKPSAQQYTLADASLVRFVDAAIALHDIAYAVTASNATQASQCKLCQCDKLGSLGSSCEKETGQCQCRPGFTGQRCDQCESGAGIFPSCSAGCDCSEQGMLKCFSKLNVCQCREGYTGTKCDQCADGYTGYPHCQGIFIRQNITGLVVISMLFIIGLLLVWHGRRSPLFTHRNEPLARLVGVANTVLEVVFIVHLQPDRYHNAHTLVIAGSAAMAASCLLYGILVRHIILRERGSNISFHAWLDYYSKATWLTSVLAAIVGPVQMLLLQSRIHRYPALSAPMRDATVSQLRAAGLIGVLVHAPMMLAVQAAAVFMLDSNKRDLITLLSMGLVLVTLLVHVWLDHDQMRHARDIFRSTLMLPNPSTHDVMARIGGNIKKDAVTSEVTLAISNPRQCKEPAAKDNMHASRPITPPSYEEAQAASRPLDSKPAPAPMPTPIPTPTPLPAPTPLPPMPVPPRRIRKKAHTTQLSAETLARMVTLTAASLARNQPPQTHSHVQTTSSSSPAHPVGIAAPTPIFSVHPPIRAQKPSAAIDHAQDMRSPHHHQRHMPKQPLTKQRSASQLDRMIQAPRVRRSTANGAPSACPHSNRQLTDALLDDRRLL
ncbi:hypothetical protein SYNPS1DRAFT_28263 [Syncephalis pseudoplumigaleata]|uniref:Laminin EGF-like domain-containing protein n=1 Tax=Syncephalis pseudoplumigaleata TaxID=1712513 RepID=A0A4P9Z3D3_9FUNG|nr:hypothetical protein SYNPS1DRAFT_28263 [Syncephalis pseudoplumigaleata]|eukprot:RKP26020.1 hypothetical protein SYNPS1DRAFT_28263 [Syncephalis pseudoplumigaleata]